MATGGRSQPASYRRRKKRTMIQAMADSGLPNLRPYLNLIDLSKVPASEMGIKAKEESVLASFYDTV